MGDVVHYRDFKRVQHWSNMEMPNLMKLSPEDYAKKWLIADTAPSEYCADEKDPA